MFQSRLTWGGSYSTTAYQEQPIGLVRNSDGRSPSMRFFVCALLLLITGLLPPSARAEVTCNNQSGSNQFLIAGTVSVPANAAVGTTVSTLAPITYTMQCYFINAGQKNTSATNTARFTTTAALAFGADVYSTGVPGLGVRYIFNSSACKASNVVLTNGNASIACFFTGPLGGPYMPAAITVTAQLVVTGTIRAGVSNLTTSPVVAITFVTSDNPGTLWPQGNLYTGSAAGTIMQSTCSVNQSKVSVPLATANTRAFPSVGSVFGPQSFALSLACASGARVFITLTDSVNPANRTNTLALTADSTAKGIGVQILNASGPVSYGADSATPGNTNQWPIGNSPNGQLQVPLTARYISIGSVSAGTAKALVTFTLSYQ